MAPTKKSKKKTPSPSESREGRIRPRMADGEEVHQMLVRLPVKLHEKLRKRAYDETRHKSEIIRDALTLYLRT